MRCKPGYIYSIKGTGKIDLKSVLSGKPLLDYEYLSLSKDEVIKDNGRYICTPNVGWDEGNGIV